MKISNSKPKRNVLFFLLVMICILAGNSWHYNLASASVSEDELIKQTYYKLSFYNSIGNKVIADRSQRQYNSEDYIQFEIFNLHTGAVSELYEQDVESLLDQPSKEIIQLSRDTESHSNSTEKFVTYSAKWTHGQYTSAIVPRKMNFSELFKLSGAAYSDIGKYTSYNVKVHLRGKSRTYKAVVLYHTLYQSTQELKPEFLDCIVGLGGTLNDVYKESLPPIGARRKNFGENRKLDSLDSSRPVGTTSNTRCLPTQPMCCPVTALSIEQCYWNPEYPYEKPIQLDNCKNCVKQKSGTHRNDEHQYLNLKTQSQPSTRGCVPGNTFSSGRTEYLNGRDLHNSGGHSLFARMHGRCTIDNTCNTYCTVEQDFADVRDNGVLSTILYSYHVGKASTDLKTSGGYRDFKPTCARAIGASFSECIFSTCNVSSNTTVSLGLFGASVSVSGGDLWNQGYAHTNTCDLSGFQSDSPPPPPISQCANGCRPINSGSCNSGTFIDTSDDGTTCCCPPSPIIVDISRYWDSTPNSGNGYRFTNVDQGVRFDLNGDGIKEQVAWPTATSENAWLALDRNSNGVIDNGKELFGNFTDQTGPFGEPVTLGNRNGWQALAELDRGRSGGNENGMIDRGDAMFPNLRLWVDRNHNGLSESNELLLLASIGLTGIGINYDTVSGWTDQHGNEFKLRCWFKWGDRDDPASFYIEWYKDAWDVFPQWVPWLGRL